MDILDDDLVQLWKALHNHNVRYIMVGGFAAIFHGTSRITQDADIWIEDTLQNRQAFRKALEHAEVGDFEMLETMEFVPGFTTIYLNEYIELDLFTSLKFFTDKAFNECYLAAETAMIEDVPVKFLSLQHLIDEKKAVSRPKDQLDIEELEKIKNFNPKQ